MTKKKPIGKLKQAIKEGTPVALKFETARDLVLFQLQGLKQQVKKIGEESGVDLSGDISSIDDTYNFFKSTITSLKIYPNQGGEFPYSYDVNFIIRENESKEDVERLVKNYLTSETFNLILARLDPNVLNILIEYEKGKEDVKEIEKSLEKLKKEKEKLVKEKNKLKKKAGEKTKLRTGKHFIDNALRNNIESQLPLFESLKNEDIKSRIKEDNAIEYINHKGEGIILSKGELKLLLCLAKILQDQSNIIAPEKGDYYLGKKIQDIDNTVEITTEEGNVIALKTPSLTFTLYEITKEFILNDEPGGNDIKEVAKILQSLAYSSDKKALIRYTRKENLGKGRERIRKIETYAPLINITNFEQEDFLNGKKIDRAKEVFVRLHPVFIDQIEKLYIELPLPKDVMTAYGGSNVSEVVFKLIFELSRALSNKGKLPKDEDKNYIYTIGVKKLHQKIAENYYRQRNHNTIKKYIDKATSTAIALGMLKGYTQEVGSTGDKQYKFILSKDW